MSLRSLDLIVAFNLLHTASEEWTYETLGERTGASPSESRLATQRLVASGLFQPPQGRRHRPRVIRRALVEFLAHGVRYAFFGVPAAPARGMRTGAAAPPLDALLAPSSELSLVWPDPSGTHRGLALEPLHHTVPEVAAKDPQLYEYLALTDAVRCGGTRERKLAVQALKERILHG